MRKKKVRAEMRELMGLQSALFPGWAMALNRGTVLNGKTTLLGWGINNPEKNERSVR